MEPLDRTDGDMLNGYPGSDLIMHEYGWHPSGTDIKVLILSVACAPLTH